MILLNYIMFVGFLVWTWFISTGMVPCPCQIKFGKRKEKQGFHFMTEAKDTPSHRAQVQTCDDNSNANLERSCGRRLRTWLCARTQPPACLPFLKYLVSVMVPTYLGVLCATDNYMSVQVYLVKQEELWFSPLQVPPFSTTLHYEALWKTWK